MLLGVVGSAGYAAGQAATSARDATVDFTPSATVVSTDGVAGMTPTS